ncbi:hypothetical protein [Ectobacillus ponti]|uniref:Uncharacterized protein n=1 Tax=Ectobacillus ponti TaxID=2961894 RepID=A0AA41X8A0_9BACI|nr:hypothetical protein [Ectobacillus ponti]MCP8970724.1 hypothetical protein [Ectobacillus ponti]
MQDVQEAVKQAKFALMQAERSPEHASGQLDAAVQALWRCLEGEEAAPYALEFAHNEMKNAALAMQEPSRTQPLQYFFGQAMQACQTLEQEMKKSKNKNNSGENS